MKAAHQPYMKWYPTDWRADPRLRMCSLAARGLWIELIGYMHEGEPYGHLTINGKSPTVEDMSSLVGRPLGEVRKALADLEERQVYSVDDAGRMFSRRMVRDKAKAEKDKENGKGGGNPKLRGEDKVGVNPPDKAQIPEARDQIPEKKEEAPDGATASPSKVYAFENGVIRLNQKDFDLWKASFSNIDVAAELIGMTAWASEQRSWFNAVKGALAKKNQQAKERQQALEKQGGFHWKSGIEGVI